MHTKFESDRFVRLYASSYIVGVNVAVYFVGGVREDKKLKVRACKREITTFHYTYFEFIFTR